MASSGKELVTSTAGAWHEPVPNNAEVRIDKIQQVYSQPSEGPYDRGQCRAACNGLLGCSHIFWESLTGYDEV